MATTINAANISASFDITKLKEGMNATRAEISKLGSILRTAEPATNKLSRDLDLLKRAFGSGAIDAGQFANAINNVVQQANLPPRMQSQVDKLSRSFMEGRIDIDQYRASLDKLQTRMNTLDATKAQKQVGKGGLLGEGRQMLGNVAGGMLATFGLSSLASGAARSIETIDDIGDAATKAGISFNNLIVLEKTLGEVGGVSVEQVRSGIGKMQVNLANARDKGGELADSLRRIGLDASQLANMDAVTAFGLIAERSQQIQGHADKMQFAMQLFGKAGMELVPALDVSRGHLSEMESHLQSVGLLLGQERADAVGAMNDELARMRDLWTSITLKIGEEFFPVVQQVMKDFKSSLDGIANARIVIRDALGFDQPMTEAEQDAEAKRRFDAIVEDRRRKTEAAFEQARKLNKEIGWTKDIERFIDDIKTVEGTGQRMLDAQGLLEVLQFAKQNREEKAKAQAEFDAQLLADEIDQTMQSLEEGIRSIEKERADSELQIVRQSDQMQREIDRESQRKIGEADTNIAPAIRAGTVEAYKMMNRQNEDARHRQEHLAKLSSMETEMKKFNEKNFAVLSKRR
jgi:hypothetical protein